MSLSMLGYLMLGVSVCVIAGVCRSVQVRARPFGSSCQPRSGLGKNDEQYVARFGLLDRRREYTKFIHVTRSRARIRRSLYRLLCSQLNGEEGHWQAATVFVSRAPNPLAHG
uniref:RxLR effector candidate protein n=1 Tax=Hyaloperonospora arabidopsidis (strain Emoy2) TaxID=559515 RepID=M4B4C2_HYAAE